MALVQRPLQTAARLLAAEGQAAALWQGFSRQQHWQQQAHHPLHPAAAAPSAPGGLRRYSDLAERKPGTQEDLVYDGPFRTAVKRVKKLSLFSCACSVGAAPVILALDTTMTLTAKASICGTLATFGIFTTGLLTWFTQPYIQRLRYERGTDTLELTTLSLLAQPRTDRFHVSEVREADTVHPLTSFKARGRYYYVDAEHFPDKQLLARLVPQTAAAAAMEAAGAQVQQLQGQQQQQQPKTQQQQAQPQQASGEQQ